MRAHIAAVRERLEELTFEGRAGGDLVYAVDVPEGVAPAFPYFLVWSSTGRLVAGSLRDDRYLDDRVGVTVVALTPEGVWSAAAKARAALDGWTPTVDGQIVQPLRLVDSQAVQPDRDVTLPNSNRHPYFGVDLYRLVSEPDVSAPASVSSSSL